MPNTREKLIELLRQVQDYGTKHTNEQWSVTIKTKGNETIADHLIANGVTVQKPQKPIEHKVDVTSIVVGNAHWCKGTTLYKCPKCGNFISRIYDYCFKCGQDFDWSDLPQPPKGE